MQDECEKEGCHEPRTCFHYCDKHHQEICLSGHATLQEFLAAQQGRAVDAPQAAVQNGQESLPVTSNA